MTEELTGQDLVDDIVDEFRKQGKYDPNSIEQRWDELDTYLQGSVTAGGGTSLTVDELAADATRALLLAVLERTLREHKVECDRLCDTHHIIEALGK